MRIRSTKPEYWRSETIAALSWEDRLLLKGMESYVDDNGVGKDSIARISGDLFSHDLIREPSRTVERISEGLKRIEKAGLIWRYTVDGDPLVFVSSWERIQRIDKPTPGRMPRPDGTLNYGDSDIRESSRGLAPLTRILAPGTGEQGNRGTGERGGADAPAPSPFCSKHPNGTDRPCRACGVARLAYEAARAAEKAKPSPSIRAPKTCDIHAHYPLPCERCAADAKEAS